MAAPHTAVVNLRSQYVTLVEGTRRALLARTGDSTALNAQRAQVLQFFQYAEPHQGKFETSEWNTLTRSIHDMVDKLDEACFIEETPPDGGPLRIVHAVRTGRPGRPRIDICPVFLTEASRTRGPVGIAQSLGGHVRARTVRRRLLEHGLGTPQPAVFESQVQEDGDILVVRNAPVVSDGGLNDNELDHVVHDVLERFPSYGRAMLDGQLRSMGYNIAKNRLIESYRRVRGIPHSFGDRTIHRRTYKVAGANALWHHDGQHGLIKYKLVIHCFIDGHSRFITGLGVSTNNRARTVLDIFLAATEMHGVPSRVRGDHGTENLEVAKWIIELRGEGRGSYIFGMSIHNTRIERLWFDVTRNFGQLWKNFFIDLEMYHGLNPRNPVHIWLLHHLFLASIRADAALWVEAWNSHVMQLPRGQTNASPRDMFLFSMVANGPRGFAVDNLQSDEDAAGYGVDWEAINNNPLMAHFEEQNPQDAPAELNAEHPFSPNAPHRMSEVLCEAPNCPFTDELVAELDGALASRVDVFSTQMEIRRLVWQEAFSLCNYLYGVVHPAE